MRNYTLDKETFTFDTDMTHQQRRLPKTLAQREKAAIPAPQPSQTAVVRRKSVANFRANNAKPSGNSLKNSIHLQRRLRQLTHQVLAAQEDERTKISHELQDEVAQTLLGLNVRLLLLKQTARSKAMGLKNQIASAQRLAVKSTTLVRRLARELDHHQPTPSELSVLAV